MQIRDKGQKVFGRKNKLQMAMPQVKKKYRSLSPLDAPEFHHYLAVHTEVKYMEVYWGQSPPTNPFLGQCPQGTTSDSDLDS